MSEKYDLYISGEEEIEFQNSSIDDGYFLSNMEISEDDVDYKSLSNRAGFTDFLSSANKTRPFEKVISHSSSYFEKEVEENELTDDGVLNRKQKYQYDLLYKKLESNIIGETQYLIEEGIELPNELVIDFAQNILYFLAYYSIYPDKLTTTVEGGICLIFYNGSERMYLELYNEGDYGYIIEDLESKKLKENKNLNSLDEIIQRLRRFYF